MARPRIVLDWDDTLVEGVWPDVNGAWKPGAVEALRELAEIAELVVSSCRIAPVGIMGEDLSETDVMYQIQAMRDQLDEAGLTMVGIWTEPYKPRAVAYVDDKSVYYTGTRTAWPNLVDKLTMMVEGGGKSKTKSKSGSSKREVSLKRRSTLSA